jgi:RNA polymerase sigma-70 factor (ECF subfamily)
VRQAAAGDRAAFGQLYEAYLGQVYGYLHFHVQDEARAEDLTQDVFVRALRGLPGLAQPERFRPWLLRISHNCLVDHWQRARQATEHRHEAAAPDGEAADPVASLADADEISVVELHLEAAELLGVAAGLTPLQQEVLSFRFVAGLSVAETAQAMDRSQNAVKNLQHHALAGLRRLLAAREAAGG